MSDANAAVRDLLDTLIAEGRECGLQVAAYLNGRQVVDVWAGIADDTTGRLVAADTLFTVFSATKGLLATAIHLLAERGVLNYDTPIADYWPAFAAQGKQAVTIRHALSHRAGIPDLPPEVTPDMRCDWEAMCACIAGLTPQWEAGTRSAYHGQTFGWILGEVLRRVDGRDVRTFVHDEIGAPLGAPDLHIGIASGDEARAARLLDADGNQATASHAAIWNRSEVRQAIIPAAGGLVTARSLARHYAMLAGGGTLDGVRVLAPETIAVAAARQTPAVDAAAIGMVFGLGYRLGSTIYPDGGLLSALGRLPSVFGHTGAGGALGIADPAHGFAFALTKNLLHPGGAGQASPTPTIVRTVRSALGLPA